MKIPGGGGTSFRRFSPHSFTPIFEEPPVYPDLRGATLRFRHHMRLMHPEWIYGMRHAAPLSPVASVDCAYFPSPRGWTLRAVHSSSVQSALSPLGALCASVAKTSALTLLAKKSIAAQRNAPITRSSLRWRLALEHLDPSLRPLRPLVAFRAGRLAPHHRSLHFAGRPPREAALVRPRRSRHRDPRRHSHVPYARIAGRRQLPLRRRHRADEYRLDRRRRRLSLRHLRQHRRLRDHEGLSRRHLLGSPSATAPGCFLLWRVHRRLCGIRFASRHRRRLHDRSG